MWRGIASLSVVLYHSCAVVTGRFPSLDSNVIYRLGSLGYLGVQIFFVISGYCISGAACSALRKGNNWTSFIRARFLRIYPPCWFSLILVFMCGLLANYLVERHSLRGSTLAQRDFIHQSLLFYVANLTLTQMLFRQNFLSIVCWTLCYEMAFYVIVSLFVLFRSKRNGQAVLLNALTIAGLLLLAFSPEYRLYPFDLWPQFGLGAMVYDIVMHPGEPRPKRWLMAAGLATAIFVLARHIPTGPQAEPSRITYCATYAYALLLVALHPFDNMIEKYRAVRTLGAIGAFSYSLYLIHFLALGITNQIFRIIPIYPVSHLVLLSACIGIAVGSGRIFYQFFELPFLRQKSIKLRSGETGHNSSDFKSIGELAEAPNS